MIYIAINENDGAENEIDILQEDLEEAVYDGVDECSGPCACSVETDGICPEGWPSRCITAGIV